MKMADEGSGTAADAVTLKSSKYATKFAEGTFDP
jgi:hypothetical protein